MKTAGQNKPILPSGGLFERIISAIRMEEEFKQTRKLLVFFAALLAVSVATLPLSVWWFDLQWHRSDVAWFIFSALSNFPAFFAFWQNFMLSILENLPLAAITLLALNAALALFTLRLFLYKKGFLIRYVRHQFLPKPRHG